MTPRIASLICALLVAGSPAVAAPDDARCLAVSIPPQAWVAERLAGPIPLRIEVVLPPGSSPATYDPSARRLASLATCNVLVSAGVPFESALFPRIEESFPELHIVDGLEGIELLDFEGHAHHHHDDAGGGHTCGSGADPHFWLDPERVLVHAHVIARELAALFPDQSTGIASREAALAGELRALDSELRTLLTPLEGRRIAVYHPSFGYFLTRYGMSQAAIESEGRDPGPRRLAEIVSTLRASQVHAVIVQPEFATTSARRVAQALGAPTLTLDPLSRDYARNLRTMAEKLVAAHEDRR
jgi:zinc transport system substrate-binding protein